ncbi:hypothetical protein SAMN05444159_5320 [Bradyrhizobium lablabi]|uniref:Uncharacterized protein n=1 Tax=Bradyrhizobium lablabi TaxID=722472 RepID=A0A1M6YSJ6_9BRAD|nr:hypothetical protein SAMN05444159_5320 [Bradyrhizobium lablabi]
MEMALRRIAGYPSYPRKRVSSNRKRLTCITSAAAYWIVRSSRTMTAEFVSGCCLTRSASIQIQFQMIPPQFFALDAANGAIGHSFFGGAIIDHMDRKGAARRPEHAKFLDRLASGPKPQLLEAVLHQICPANSHGVFKKKPMEPSRPAP